MSEVGAKTSLLCICLSAKGKRFRHGGVEGRHTPFQGAVVVATPGIAGDPAPRDAVAGRWIIEHGNGAEARIKVLQNGRELGGSGREAANTGALDGVINGRDVSFEIEWSNGHTGVYDGSISADGRLRGVNHDKADPGAQTNWSVRRSFACP